MLKRATEYRILGSFEVRVEGRLVALGGEKPRALLAILLLNRNEVVPTDQLIDDLWGEAPPASALSTLRAYVSRLRKALNGQADSASCGPVATSGSREGALLTQGRGYLLRVAPAELDLERFREMTERGHEALAAGDANGAARALREALGLWRGPPLTDFAYEPFARAAIAQAEELRLAAVEDRVEADMALGRARELVGELRDLAARHPLRERLRGQLMLALYRSGRQAEALETYQEFRRKLAEELGLEPGSAVQQLERAILGHDPALDLPQRVAKAAGPPREPSRTPNHVRRRWIRWVLPGLTPLALAFAFAAAVLPSQGRRGVRAMTIPGDSVAAINPTRGGVGAVVPLGTSPSALAAGNGALWAANYNQGTISRIDPRTRAVVQTIQAGTSPASIAVGARAVWVTDTYGGAVLRIDPAVDRTVQTIPVGNAPSGIAVDQGSVWVANSSDGTLSRIDPVSGAIRDTIALGGNPTDVVASGDGIWVSDEANHRIVRVDPYGDQVVASIDVGTGPTAVTAAFGSVWVVNSLDGTVSRIDPATNRVEATITAGDGAGAIAVGRGSVWIANQYAGTVSEIDPATDTIAHTLTVGNRPEALAVAGGLVWVAAQPVPTRHRGGTLTILTDVWPNTIDPALASLAAGVEQLNNDGLIAYRRVGGTASTQLVPDLAVSLPSPTDGGTTYTFQLRRGIHYSNGRVVRPEDFRRALERDLILGPNSVNGGPFAQVVGGAACAEHPSHCDLSRGVVTDDAAYTVTFHLVAPNPEFLARLTLPDAVAVPAGTPDHDLGMHCPPATGPYKCATIAANVGVEVRNPYFHEWSHAARPDGYPDRIVFRLATSPEAEVSSVERGTADNGNDGVPPDRLNEVRTRFASQLHVHPAVATDALILNTHTPPFNDVRVRRALNYAIDRAKIARLLGQDSHPTCQLLPPYLPGYQRYCPYTLRPNAAGTWQAPNLAEAERLTAASHTRGTPITIWDLGAWQTDYSAIRPYLVTLFDRLGYPTRFENVANAPDAPLRFADSRTGAQAGLGGFSVWWPSASQIIQRNFACQSFIPHSTGNSNLSEFCDPRLDAQIRTALAAESNNSPNAPALWTRTDRTVTDEAPVVPLITPSVIDFVSARSGNYQYSFQQEMLWDQLWVR